MIVDKDHPEWTDKFIEVIKARPAIYNKALPEHNDRSLCQMLWMEICREMFPDWNLFSPKDSVEKEKMLKSRWRNLCTCFQRERKKQKQDKSINSSDHKRRKYIYFEQLNFLITTLDNSRPPKWKKPSPRMKEPATTVKNEDSSSISSIEFNFDSDPLDIEANDIPEYHIPVSQSDELRTADGQTITTVKMDDSSIDANMRESFTSDSSTTDVTINKPLTNKKRKLEQGNDTAEEADENKLFLDSILPSLRKMNFAQQIEAKIAFMATIRRIMTQQSGSRDEMNESDEERFVKHPDSLRHPQCFLPRDNSA